MLAIGVGLLACTLDTTPAGIEAARRAPDDGSTGSEAVPGAPGVRLDDVGLVPLGIVDLPPPVDDTPPEWQPFYDEGPGDFLFAHEEIQDFDLELDDSAMDDLASAPTVPVHGEFRWQGESWDVGVRLKGSTSFRTLAQKAAFKIDFHEWDPDARFHGLKSLTLNNMIADPTMVREHSYYWYCAQLGIPAPRHAYARVRVNGTLFGLYGVVETVNGQLVDRLWPDDDEGAILEGSGDDLTPTLDHYEIEREGEGDVGALVSEIASTSDAGLLDLIDTRFGRGAMAYWALDLAAGNDDGYARNHHNYFLYYQPLSRRWSMIPWGTDRSFEDHTPIHGDALTDNIGVLVTRCVADSACRERLDATIADVAEGWTARGLDAYAEATADLIRDDCESDPRRELDCDPDRFIDYLLQRQGEVKSQAE